MSLKNTLIKWLIPSNWIKWLKGKKRLLGVIALALWAAIYAVPQLYPELAYIAPIALEIQKFLISLGLELNQELLMTGSAVTVIGLLDWILKHLVSDTVIFLLKAIEGAPKKIQNTVSEK